MYANSYKVTVKTAGGSTVVFNDATDAGAGASAYGAVDTGIDIKANVSGKLNIIPFHAVDTVVVEITRSEVDDPTDETCVVETEGGESEGGDNEGGDNEEP